MRIIAAIIYAAAVSHGVSPAALQELARCESTFRPWVVSPEGYVGLFQMASPGLLDEFREWEPTQGFTVSDWADPARQSNFTAEQLAKDRWGPWPACSRRARLLLL